MKRFTCTSLSPPSILFVYATDATSAAIKAHRAGFTVGDVTPAGCYDPARNLIVEVAKERSGKNGANGQHVNGAGR